MWLHVERGIACVTVLQVKTDDKTHHLLTQKFFSPPATHPPPPIDDVVHRARR